MVLYKNVLERHFCANKHISKNTKNAKKFLYIIYKARGNKTMINFELLCKTNRHDSSMTESEKKQFRMSKEWLEFRQKVAANQNNRDYITGEPLLENYNCHHCCMINSEYTNLNEENFVAVNKDTHTKIHELFKPGWRDIVKQDDPYYKVLDKMAKLNDDIEIVLYDNVIEYKYTNAGNKLRNKELAEQYRYPVNEKGYMQWNHNYIPAGYPQDTNEWCKYMTKINDNYTREFMKIILELRHINLYSSYKNFRNNPKIRQNTKDECRKELETTTKILRKYFGY